MDIDLSIVLIGLPNVGKSLIFNLLTGLDSDVSPYPISTPKPLHGVVEWIDPRMPLISKVIRPEQIFPLKIQVTDTIGIMPEQHQSIGGFAESLDSMRSADVLCYVARYFTDPTVSHSYPDLNTERDSKVVWAELCSIDCELVNNKLAKLERTITRGSKDPDVLFENDLLKNRVILSLHKSTPLCEQTWNEKELRIFDSLALVTHKPYFILMNYGENQVDEFASNSKWKDSRFLKDKHMAALCARLEADIMSLPLDERREFLSLYDGFELASHNIVPMALDTINRITYFTFGHLGLKQWSVPKGTTAVGAAKRLHTDFANRFVAAEVTTTDALIEAGSVDQLKSQGKMRLEGRDYLVHDGDILYFRFSK